MARPSSLDIARIAGALGLEPANASHEGRLFTLLRAGLDGEGLRRMRSPSQAQVRALLEAHPGPRWDPPETLFTARIPFHGGDHLVLTGGYEGLDTAVEHIVASLFLHKHAPPGALAQEASQLTGAVLRLSDHAVRAAGLGRHEPCGRSNEVVVPTTAELRRLLGGVSFTRRELDEITSAGTHALEPLIAEVADVEPASDGIRGPGSAPELPHTPGACRRSAVQTGSSGSPTKRSSGVRKALARVIAIPPVGVGAGQVSRAPRV
jgi:hypothetical protein